MPTRVLRTDVSAPRGRAAPAPQPQAPQGGSNPLESLPLDIARLLDRDLAADMWDRYQRGETQGLHQAPLHAGRPEDV